jgi:hypothetical protein
MNWVKLYGGCPRVMTSRQNPCPPLFKQTLVDLLALATITKTSIDKYFPPTIAYAPYVTKMGYSTAVAPNVYTLLVYTDMYPGKKLAVTNVIDLNNLKDIYLMLNIPWNNDPILSSAVNDGII